MNVVPASGMTALSIGKGVTLNDNSGIGSALVWQTSNGRRSIGVAGVGLKASDVQRVAGSLR